MRNRGWGALYSIHSTAIGIAFCIASTAHAQAPAGAEQRAVEHHRKALELYDAGDVSLALVEFERAYAENGSYKTLFNIGEIHFQLGHYAKAQQTLEKYLKVGGDAITEARRAEVEQDLTKLRRKTAGLTVTVTPANAAILVNEEPAQPASEVLVNAGTLQVKISQSGFAPQTRELVLAGGEHQTLGVQLVPAGAAPPPVASPKRGVAPEAIAGWITTGVLLAGTIGVGIAALGKSSSYDDARLQPITTTPAAARSDLESQRSTVKALGLTTDILGAATVVAGGVSLYLTLRPRKPTAPKVGVQGLGARFEVAF